MSMWLTIKYTIFGKIGAFFIGIMPFMLAAEVDNHINALIAAIPPTLAVIVGVFALRRGQKVLMVNLDGRMEQLLKVTGVASKAEGKEEERGEARERRSEIKHEMAVEKGKTDEPQDVKIVNPVQEPANVKVGNLPTESMPVTLTEKQEKIDKAQGKLDREIKEEGNERQPDVP